ncbi:MAG: high-potential iron-sulfur protein [Hydrogenophaga sp.]
MVDEADPAAVALGYVADSARADQACGNCVLFQGAAGSEAGPCPLFAGKQVSANGWCASYVKKTA